MFKNVLIVCIGNICRSPVAEAMFNQYFQANNITAKATSAGISALAGEAAAIHSQELMQAQGIDITSHIARQLTQEMILESDLVLVMEQDQIKFINSNYPFARGKVHKIGRWQDMDIPDPYEKAKNAYVTMVKNLEICVKTWTQQFW